MIHLFHLQEGFVESGKVARDGEAKRKDEKG